MIYFFTGNNHKELIQKKQDLIKALQTKQPGASVVQVDSEEITADFIEGLFETQGLFLDKQIVSFGQVCEEKDQWAVLKKNLKDFAEREDIIIWSEIHTKVLAPLKKKIEEIKKLSQKTVELNKAKESSNEQSPELFTFAGQFFTLPKKNLWVAFQKVRDEVTDGDVPLNMLLWQTRAILQSRASNAEDSGLKPFVYSKSRVLLDRRGEKDIKNTLVELTKIGQEMRMDKKKGYILLEQYILNRS